MSANTEELYKKYTALLQKAADFDHAAAVLGWDQEVYMPAGGAKARGRQLSTLAAAAHEIRSSGELGRLLYELSAHELPHPAWAANIKWSLADYERNSKLPTAFVAELSSQASICYHHWVLARTQRNYSLFQPHLEKMIALKRQEADYVGYQQHPYDALLGEYDYGSTVAQLDPLFDEVKHLLAPILARVKSAPEPSVACLLQHFPKQQQWDFSMEVLNTMGYNLEFGRQDYAPHPFTTSFGATDVRITTRVDEHNFASLLWSTIHEGGHALYEQGLPDSEYGLPCGNAASLSIHESQSRLWENCIGRSLEFWNCYYPRLQQIFPAQLGTVSVTEFWRAANKVMPSLIRTEADELTYHFHIMIRYTIEKQLIAGALSTADIPEYWSALYQQYLGIAPAHHGEGVLQDVHWSHGSFGYFPTYSTGSFYAAQFLETALQQPVIAAGVANGSYNGLLSWLREHIHNKGRQLTSGELCTAVTGRPLDLSCFARYMNNKMDALLL
ncbi:MAG: carboxypeptidase M32 [Chitinophagia bacterium]|nr:carboxypeptidase M32 [Chitinophagia bacterium]